MMEKDFCYTAFLPPASISISELARGTEPLLLSQPAEIPEANVIDMDVLMDKLCHGNESEEKPTDWSLLDLKSRKTIQTLLFVRAQLATEAEILDIPHMQWNRIDKPEYIPNSYFDILVAADTGDGSSMLQQLHLSLIKNPYSTLIMSLWQQPTPVDRAIMRELNRERQRIAFNVLSDGMPDIASLSDQCRGALLSSYCERIDRSMND